MSFSKIKRSLHDKEKLRKAIRSLESSHFKAIEECRKLFIAITGECLRLDCATGKKCWECRDDELNKKEAGVS